MLVHPAGQQPGQHSHGFEGSGVFQRAFGERIRLHPEPPRLAEQPAGRELSDQRQGKDNDGPNERHPEQPWVQEPENTDEEGRERRVKEGQHRVAAQKVAQLVKVAQRLGSCIARAGTKGSPHAEQRAEHLPRKLAVYIAAYIGKDARARSLQHGQQRDQRDGNAHERVERVFRLRGDHAVVDLQHENRADEQKEVGEHGGHQNGPETNLCAAQSLPCGIGRCCAPVPVLRCCGHADTPFIILRTILSLLRPLWRVIKTAFSGQMRGKSQFVEAADQPERPGPTTASRNQ
ncbi:MAG: Uncharacterised protein [Rhodospirillaceae bacterium]|nr:MAG: Uncharacterised protein [Rhodospirillaceae bacterium]